MKRELPPEGGAQMEGKWRTFAKVQEHVLSLTVLGRKGRAAGKK